MAWFFSKKDESSNTLKLPSSDNMGALIDEHQAPSPETLIDNSGFLGKMKAALSKTRNNFIERIREVAKAASTVDDALIENIEEILIKSDIGAETAMRITEELREFEARGASPKELMESFKEQLHSIISKNSHAVSLQKCHPAPLVILMVGVNGTGKTTTIGKLASEFRSKGRKVLLAAGDTFRAAAIEQLEIWSQRTGSGFVSRQMGSDPSGVAYEACEKGVQENYDVVLIDTAGRLHTKVNLMDELKKIVRVIKKVIPDAPHETLLVLDATTGQNAIQQAKVFSSATELTGLVLTKLDGTAKGGVLIGICNQFNFPIVKIGIGEGIDDLRDFDAKQFIDALFAE